MKKELINHFTWLVNRIAECNTYNWSAEYKERELKKAFKKFYDSLNKENRYLIDLQTMTVEQAKELRFCKWISSDDIDEEIAPIESRLKNGTISYEEANREIQKFNNIRNLFLFPLWFVPLIPKGTELTTITGYTFTYNGDISEIDTDIRCGCVAYGIKLKEAQQKPKFKDKSKIIELPCKVGDEVYYLGGHYERHKTKIYVDEIKKGIVDHITIGQKGVPQIDVCDDENVWTTFDCVDDLGKIVFLKKEEAEKALEGLK